MYEFRVCGACVARAYRHTLQQADVEAHFLWNDSRVCNNVRFSILCSMLLQCARVCVIRDQYEVGRSSIVMPGGQTQG